MLLKLVDHLKKLDNFKPTYCGKVVLNTDPDKLGRIKCTIAGRWVETDTNKLPWIYPLTPAGLGGKSDCSSFAVPEVGSEVAISFPYSDEYFPVYIGYWQSSITHQTLFDDDYPETYGFTDSKSNHVKVNKSQDTIEVKHGTSGATIKILSSGEITVTTPDKINLVAEKDVTITTDEKASIVALSDVTIAATGVCDVSSVGNTTVTAPVITLAAAVANIGAGAKGARKKVMNEDLIAIFNNHTHSGVESGTQTSGTVNSGQASLDQATEETSAS